MSFRATPLVVVPRSTKVRTIVAELARERSLPCIVAPDEAAALAACRTARRPAVIVEVGDKAALHGELVEVGKLAALLLVGAGANLERVARWSGADEHMTLEELSPRALGRAIGYAIDRRRTQELVDELLSNDPVTGVAHAAAFRARLARAVDAASLRPAGRAGLLLVDLDRFDLVNETFGFDAGDALLREAAHRLAAALGRDTVARFHADKLAVLFDEEHGREAIVGRVRQALEQPYLVDRQEVELTTSMGIAEFPSDAPDADALLRATTQAMRRAKHAGRNNVQLASQSLVPPATATRSRERYTMERDLRRAVERGELLLHYQPQLDVRTGGVLGVEALVRWMRPGVGMISPADFVPLLEETGLILPASDWIFEAACKQIAAWHEAGLPPLRVAVNVSATQIRQRRLLASVQRALEASHLDPRLLELELTESLLIENTAANGSTLDAIREVGVGLALDDFGTGYSSLSYLKRLPIDVVKIDRSFLRGVPSTAADAAITSAIITLAHELGHRVVAEGVETAEQLRFLEEHGCDAVQGFYFSKPLAADPCREWLEQSAPRQRGTSGTYLAPDVKVAPQGREGAA